MAVYRDRTRETTEVAELRANAETAARHGDQATARTLNRWADELEARS